MLAQSADGIQVISLPTADSIVGLGADNASGLVHVLPTNDIAGVGTKYIGLILNPNLLTNGQGKLDLSGEQLHIYFYIIQVCILSISTRPLGWGMIFNKTGIFSRCVQNRAFFSTNVFRGVYSSRI